MKTSFYLLAVLLILATQSCSKEKQPLAVYDNSKSFINLTVSPVTTLNGETITAPPITSTWSFSQQYNAPRMASTTTMAPFFGYPTGAFNQTGQLVFDYSNTSSNGQGMALFFNSAISIKGPGNYSAISGFGNGYAAIASNNSLSKNLYFSGNDQTITVNSCNNYRMCDNSSVNVLAGSIHIFVSDAPNGGNVYEVSGTFQFPVSASN